jgi:hypothetical protein
LVSSSLKILKCTKSFKLYKENRKRVYENVSLIKFTFVLLLRSSFFASVPGVDLKCFQIKVSDSSSLLPCKVKVIYIHISWHNKIAKSVLWSECLPLFPSSYATSVTSNVMVLGGRTLGGN